jgi:hypothetical protein
VIDRLLPVSRVNCEEFYAHDASAAIAVVMFWDALQIRSDIPARFIPNLESSIKDLKKFCSCDLPDIPRHVEQTQV